jgi:Tfp pilus assembly protein PilO
MKISLNSGGWTIPALASALAVAYVALFFVPGYRQIRRLREDLETKRAFVAQASSLTSAIAATRGELQTTLQYTKHWQEAAPGHSKLPALYGEISSLAKQIGVTTTRFDPEPVHNQRRLRRIPLAIGCTGSFSQTCHLLQGIESLPPTIWLKSVRMDLDGVDGVNVKTELELDIFADNPEISDQVNTANNR